MSNLFDLCTELLEAVVDDAAALDPPIQLPERRYVSNGEVAYDCEQFTAEIPSITPGTPMADYQGPARQGELPVALIQLALIRDCAPTSDANGKPPAPSAIEDHAREVHADALLLVRAFLKRRTINNCQGIKVLECRRYGPEGEVAGWVLFLRVSL